MTTETVEPDVQDAEVVETESAAPAPEPPDDDPSLPEDEAEILQPADIEEPTGEVMLHTERGVLALKPDQTVLTPAQQASLVAINIDTEKDPGIIPHVRPFIHMCQVRGLDPWAKEAYLIARGQGRNRKYTMQTGIDGYRKMAASTGRFIRVKEILWTGADDDEKSYRAVVMADGDVVMRRVWFDQWPASRGYPGAAKAIIEHYDTAGNVITTPAVADWSMYAPFSPKKEWRNGQSTKVLDAQGHEILVLNDMWEKGYAHMLGKCAEALAHRKAFPATMSGFYVSEEMARLDQADRSEAAAVQRSARQQAYIDAQQRDQIARGPADPSTSWDADGADLAERATESARAGEPVPARTAVSETLGVLRKTQDTLAEQRAERDAQEAPLRAQEQEARAQESAQTAADVRAQDAPERLEVSAEQRAQWFRGELAFISEEVLKQGIPVLVRRIEKQTQRQYAQFTVDDLAAAVKSLRAPAVSRMRTLGDARAESYAAMEDGVAAPLDVLLGGSGQAAAGVRDPSVPHPFEADDINGICWCERFSDEMIHTV